MSDIASQTIESPNENGTYLIDADLTFNGAECWSVFFKKNDCDEWEPQKTFSFRVDAEKWVNDQISKFN